jgi:hypothetical protein
MSSVAKLLLALSLSCTVPLAAAAPGDLDTAFGGLGWIAWSAPGASGEDLCIDANHSIVVAGAKPPAGSSTSSMTHLLRYYPSGLVHFWAPNVVWRATGISTTTAQRPRVVCTAHGYTVANMADPAVPGGPRTIRLDLITPTGGFGAKGWLNTGSVVLDGSPALAHLGGSSWLVGQTRANGNWWQAALQRWDGVVGTPAYINAYSDNVSSGYARIHDAVRAPDGLIYAVGARSDYPDASKQFSLLWIFDALGNLSNAPVAGGRLAIPQDRSAVARRVAVGTNGVVYVAIQREATATDGPSVALGRIGFAPESYQTQLIPNATVGDLAIDDFGRVVVVGERDGVAFVRRYLPSGALDVSFGQAGERRYGFGSTRSRFNAVAFDAVRRIVVTGRREAVQRQGSTVPEALILARLLSD